MEPPTEDNRPRTPNASDHPGMTPDEFDALWVTYAYEIGVWEGRSGAPPQQRFITPHRMRAYHAGRADGEGDFLYERFVLEI